MKIFIKGIYNVIWFFKIRILNISIIFLIFSDVKMTAKREQKKSNVFMYSGFSVIQVHYSHVLVEKIIQSLYDYLRFKLMTKTKLNIFFV